jgi:hypothetical protein
MPHWSPACVRLRTQEVQAAAHAFACGVWVANTTPKDAVGTVTLCVSVHAHKKRVQVHA